MKEEIFMRNMMKGIVSLLLAVCMLALPVLSLAEGEPTLDGVRDQSVMAGTEFDALDGVTAADAAGGDLTDMIMIESTPALDFKNGKATPENPGDYELVYSVTDNDGVTIHRKTNLEFGALIKDSSVFDMLGFCFDGESPVKEFSDMQIGDAYDASQFNACAYFRSTDGLEVLRGSRCVSGQIEVIDKKELGEDSVITLKFNGLVFPSKDGTSTYTFNSTVDYKIKEFQYAEDL